MLESPHENRLDGLLENGQGCGICWLGEGGCVLEDVQVKILGIRNC